MLVDDRLARREARAAGLGVAGTAAIVGLARRRGLIESARDVFERLLRSDFRITPEVVLAVLEAPEPPGIVPDHVCEQVGAPARERGPTKERLAEILEDREGC